MFPHPPFTVERRWYDRYDGVTMPAPVPPTFDGKPGFYREIHERYGLDRLSNEDWAEIARTYCAMVSRVDDQLARVLGAVASGRPIGPSPSSSPIMASTWATTGWSRSGRRVSTTCSCATH